MKILFIGDIIGRPGRRATKIALETLTKTHQPDVILANGENLAHGSGISKKVFKEMREAGMDLFTGGNHILSVPDIFPEMEKKSAKVLRPANLPPGNPGRGDQILRKNGKRLLVINLSGRAFMGPHYDCPFRKADELLDRYRNEKLDGILIDLHAETTSEKGAMKHYLDGRVSALVGTHTHVQTADEEITPKGLAYLTDVGMVGPTDSVIGVEKKSILQSMLLQTKFKLDIPTGRCVFNAVVIEITGRDRSASIERVRQIID